MKLEELWEDGIGDFLFDTQQDDLIHEKQRDGEEGDASLATCTENVAVIVREMIRQGVDHDYADVLATGVQAVLGLYGLFPKLSRQEHRQLRRILLDLGGKVQSVEIGRTIARVGSSELLQSIPDRFWTVRQEEAFNKKFHERFTSALRVRRELEASCPMDTRGMVVQETATVS